MNDTSQSNYDAILPKLASALVELPRSTLQELAKAVGISKTTLYRYSRTRNELIDKLTAYGSHVLTEIIRKAELDVGDPLTALKRLIAAYLDNSEISTFMMLYWRNNPSDMQESMASIDKIMDDFFLRGQQLGVFRIHIPAPALTDGFNSLLTGLVDAQHRGRVARASVADVIAHMFLEGTAAPRT
ncbi:TetR/AcrR family transcriptional regulator [Pectobacterium cacticida]|uniref:TetR/AcrR family transcriptional regulator n=1 Tax=Pectobacterium cacticida TaxID=69221 RepID=UPI003987B541